METPESNKEITVGGETTTKISTSTITTIAEEDKIDIKKPLFLIFAEYLGYESPLIEWAEKWCSGTVIPKYQQGIIEIDAMSIYQKMQEDYTDEELHNWYNEFYKVILCEYDVNLTKMAEKNNNLPF